MSNLYVQKQPLQLTDLEHCDSFGEPIGDLPKQTANEFFAAEKESGDVSMGTWECEPGKLQLEVNELEFCHILAGHWILTGEDGTVTELKAGDSFCFPRGWKGVSEVRETVRKAYAMII
jgi:uncharacterized cupin superfamily protein